jgi:hypothetical protein
MANHDNLLSEMQDANLSKGMRQNSRRRTGYLVLVRVLF